tara:strand:- start:401 stop:598 length:198 start_codon:yes stop_codon:yes gene_type:complete
MFNLGDLITVTDTLWISSNETPTPEIKEGSRGVIVKSEDKENGCYSVAFEDRVVLVKKHFLKKFE